MYYKLMRIIETDVFYHNKTEQVLNHNYIEQCSVISFSVLYSYYSHYSLLPGSIYGSFNLSSAAATEKESSIYAIRCKMIKERQNGYFIL